MQPYLNIEEVIQIAQENEVAAMHQNYGSQAHAYDLNLSWK
ncbi:hypothetical protein [Rufibacter latericius]|nr:hypothetical protein [Rufibacter latericius]